MNGKIDYRNIRGSILDMLVLPKGPSVGQSVFQFYVALTWFSQRWGKKAPQNLVVWTWFRRCLIGLPPLSLFLRVVHNNFHWTQHFCWSRSLEELSEWMQRVWGCDLVQLWGSTGNKEELRKCLCHAGQVFSPPLVTTELLTENPTLNLALYTLLLLCSPWSWSFAVNCGGPSVCTGRGGHTPHQLFFILEAEIKSSWLGNSTFISCQNISCEIPGRALKDSSLHGQTGRGLDIAKHE